MEWEPRNLEEVMKELREIEKKRKRRIDPKIKDLVIGLRRWGINTKMSCQGHERAFPFPWIDISPKDVDKLIKVCGWYNIKCCFWNIKYRVSKIVWVILPMTWPSGEISIRLVPWERNIPLKKLQESATEFGEFLQKILELPHKRASPKLALYFI